MWLQLNTCPQAAALFHSFSTGISISCGTDAHVHAHCLSLHCCHELLLQLHLQAGSSVSWQRLPVCTAPAVLLPLCFTP